jgi:ParB/RepB/Spo0J family partition protein
MASRSKTAEPAKPIGQTEAAPVGMFDISLIIPDPDQPRDGLIDEDGEIIWDEEMKELRAAIAGAGKINHAITLRPGPHDATKFMIVDGERRWRIARSLKWEKVPGTLDTTGTYDDPATRLIAQMQANTGVPLTPLQQARAWVRLTEFGFTAKTIATQFGVTEKVVTQRMLLDELPGDMKAAIRDGKLKAVVGQAIAATRPDVAAKAFAMHQEGKWSTDGEAVSAIKVLNDGDPLPGPGTWSAADILLHKALRPMLKARLEAWAKELEFIQFLGLLTTAELVETLGPDVNRFQRFAKELTNGARTAWQSANQATGLWDVSKDSLKPVFGDDYASVLPELNMKELTAKAEGKGRALRRQIEAEAAKGAAKADPAAEQADAGPEDGTADAVAVAK